MSFVHFMLSMAGRLLRVIAGVIIIWLGLTQISTPWSFVVAAIGVVPILAGLLNFCLLGPLFDVNFRGQPRDSHQSG